MIYFTKHAELKLHILREHGLNITKNQVKKTVIAPDSVAETKFSFYVSERKINKSLCLAVIFKREDGMEKIITFYPIRPHLENEEKQSRQIKV